MTRLTSAAAILAAIPIFWSMPAFGVGADDPPGDGNRPLPPGSLDHLRINKPDPPSTLSLRGSPRRAVASGKKYALIVGVGQATFNGVKQNPLPICRLDAVAMARVLRELGFECTVMVDDPDRPVDPKGIKVPPADHPNVHNIQAELKAMLAKAGKDDTVLVYMSSHGGMFGKDSNVLAVDGAVSIPAMKESLARSKALVRVVMLDCCRDEAGQGEKAERGRGTFRPQTTEARDVHTIYACSPDEISQIGVNGLSLFTEAFVDGVSDCRADRVHDGVIELDEIIQYVAGEVPARARKQREASQHPTRTVVDPKAINPVLGICDAKLAAVSPQTTALAGPRATVTRNDWIYSSLLLQKVTEGMTLEDVTKAMGKPPLVAEGAASLADGADGDGFYPDEPGAGDTLHLVFRKGKVARVETIFGGICKEPYDAAASRAAVLKLLDGAGLDKLDAKLAGKSVREVIELIGCPTASLVATDGTGDGSLRYLDVPRPTQMLVVNIAGGKAADTEIRALGR